jgi:hypothetical protein
MHDQDFSFCRLFFLLDLRVAFLTGAIPNLIEVFDLGFALVVMFSHAPPTLGCSFAHAGGSS